MQVAMVAKLGLAAVCRGLERVHKMRIVTLSRSKTHCVGARRSPREAGTWPQSPSPIAMTVSLLASALLLFASSPAPTAAVNPAISVQLEAWDDEEPRPSIAHYNLGEEGLALAGYDPVAYFPEFGGKAKKGKKSIQVTHMGVTYHFASRSNLKAFQAKPARFEPAYGGWCAWAVAAKEGGKAPVDPKSFTVEGDRLFLFYKGSGGDTRSAWKEKGGFQSLGGQADGNWTRMSGEKPTETMTKDMVSAEHWNLRKGVAIHGFDPVSYFAGKPKSGNKRFTAKHAGVEYQFANKTSAKKFESAPEDYLPAYGGWCAFGLAKGYQIEIDPRAYLIEDGKLMFFKDGQVLEMWKREAKELESAADRKWSEIGK